MKISFDDSTLDLTSNKTGYFVTLDGKTVDVELLRASDGKLELLIDGKRVTAYVSVDGARRWVTINGQTVVLTKAEAARRRSSRHDHASDLVAPMPGLVRSVNVVEGEAVTKGQTLLVLEAMKMEIRIQAQGTGVVAKLFVAHGQTVEREQVLIEIK